MKQTMERRKSLSIPLAISVILLLVGYVFRVQHWSHGIITERIAFSLIAMFYIIRFSNKSKKTLKDTVKLILVTSWCITSILAPLKMPNVYLLQIVVTASGTIWLVMELFDLAKRNLIGFNKILFLGAIILAFEVVFRFQHLPGGSMLHLAGLLVIVAGFVVEYSRKRKLEST